jgi:ectoine hydroxylase-related dioxygenase (phytanoyl-CoA dioxygenase family)
MTCAAAPPLEALRSRFHAQGYLVLEHWLLPDELAALRRECDAVVASAAASSSASAQQQQRQRRGGGEAWVARERGCVFEVPGACGVEHACDAAAFKARARAWLATTERRE